MEILSVVSQLLIEVKPTFISKRCAAVLCSCFDDVGDQSGKRVSFVRIDVVPGRCRVDAGEMADLVDIDVPETLHHAALVEK
jgi:hypothetical protein